MSFKPNLTRKLYETTLSLDKIVHPEKLKAQTDPGEGESNVSPIKWHPNLSDTKLPKNVGNIIKTFVEELR